MHAPALRRPQSGFSLIEVMVGLAIGMATVVIMMQMLANSEASKRTTSGGNDAQMNGTIALYTLERDIRASGYGINAFNILGCTVRFMTSVDGATVNIPLAPSTINPPNALVPPGDANTDTLLVVYGNADGSSEGDPLISNSSAGTYQVSTGSAFAVGNIVIAQTASRPTPCVLTSDVVVNITGSTLSVNPGVAGLPSQSIIYNLGSAPVAHAFAVRNGTLTMCDYTAYNCGRASYTNPVNPDVWVPIAGNIVSLRAQYGRDISNPTSTMTGVVGTYDQITPASAADTSGFSPFCSWARTLSMRLAVVARSGAFDKSAPTTAAPTWSGATADTANAPTNPTALPFDLSADTSWRNFRYKALETTVPLRNSIWQGGQPAYQGGSGC